MSGPDVVKRIILAPVPCRHLDTALQMQSERIAFGTDATHFFENEAIKKRTRVLIYASRKSAGAAHLFVSGCATFEAMYESCLRTKTGNYPIPDERPPSTVRDTPFEGFWVVSAFKKLPKEQWVPFSKLTAKDSNQPLKILFPRGPMIVQIS
jgi:hypothetical protein